MTRVDDNLATENTPAQDALAAPDTPPTREQQARQEIGHTHITRAQAAMLAGSFLLIMLSAAVVQHVADLRRGQLPQMYDIRLAAPLAVDAFRSTDGGLWNKTFGANAALLRFITDYETALEDAAEISKALLPRVQRVLLAAGAGNEKAYPGQDGWLFYRADVDYVTGPSFLDPVQLRRRTLGGNEFNLPPQPDPRPAIRQFRDQLADRGITLIVMPTPVKPQIHPERFSTRYSARAEPLNNPGFAQFIQELRNDGVAVFDPTPILWHAAGETGRPVFLESDTHWTPQAMRLVAQELASFIIAQVALDGGRRALGRRAADVAHLGDVAAMLRLPEPQRAYGAQRVTVDQVFTGQDELWRPDPQGDILLLGDSFTNIFSLEAMGWGAAAGLAEQLSVELGRPIDLIARNDAGAHATREILSRELARGRDRLAGKRLVVWQFAARELSHGDWKLIDMKLGEARPGKFIAAAPDQALVVSGTVQAIAGVPRPGSVPYADHLVAIHLVDVETADGSIADAQALVYMWSMRSNTLTAAAGYRPGQRLENLRMVAWDQVQDRYGGINRGELDDVELMLEDPNWAEEMK